MSTDETQNTEQKDVASEEVADSPRLYEVSYLLVPTIAPDKLLEEADVVRKAVEEHGNIVSSNEPKETPLAYRMEIKTEHTKSEFDSAFFGFFVFALTRGEISELKNKLNNNKNIIRFMIITRTEKSLIPVQKPRPVVTTAKPYMARRQEAIKKEGETINEEDLDKTIDELVTD